MAQFHLRDGTPSADVLEFAATLDSNSDLVPHKVAMSVRKNTAAAQAASDGLLGALITDSSGKLWVNDGGAVAEDSVLSSGDVGKVLLGQFQATRGQSAGTTGDACFLGVDSQGSLYVLASQKRATLTAAPTVSSSPAYAAADVLGALMTISNAALFSGGSLVIENIIIADKSNTITDVDIVFFSSNPSSSTFTDNAAYTVNAADWDKIIGFANISNVCAAAGNRILQYTPPAGQPLVLSGSTTLYAVMVTRAGQTLASTSDIKLILVVRQD